jgi:hypothetical protein
MVAVFGLFVRAVLGYYARRAKAGGLPAAQTGAITFVQRFGSAANLHVHAHVLVMDGVFTAAESGDLTFHELPSPSDRELNELLAVSAGACCVICAGTVGSTTRRSAMPTRWRTRPRSLPRVIEDPSPGDRPSVGARAHRLRVVGAERRAGWIERALGPLRRHELRVCAARASEYLRRAHQGCSTSAESMLSAASRAASRLSCANSRTTGARSSSCRCPRSSITAVGHVEE